MIAERRRARIRRKICDIIPVLKLYTATTPKTPKEIARIISVETGRRRSAWWVRMRIRCIAKAL